MADQRLLWDSYWQTQSSCLDRASQTHCLHGTYSRWSWAYLAIDTLTLGCCSDSQSPLTVCQASHVLTHVLQVILKPYLVWSDRYSNPASWGFPGPMQPPTTSPPVSSLEGGLDFRVYNNATSSTVRPPS